MRQPANRRRGTTSSAELADTRSAAVADQTPPPRHGSWLRRRCIRRSAAALADTACAPSITSRLDPDELPLFGPEAVKGLEFDGVVVVNPHEILSEDTEHAVTERGARLLYVAMTRAVQELHFVTDSPAPPVLAEQQ